MQTPALTTNDYSQLDVNTVFNTGQGRQFNSIFNKRGWHRTRSVACAGPHITGTSTPA